MHPLVAALIEQQAREGLGSNAFARRLGIDQGTWSVLRRSNKPPAGSVYNAALRVYPEIVRRVAQGMEISIASDVPSQHSTEAVA